MFHAPRIAVTAVGPKPLYTQDEKLDIMWLVEGGCDLTFENMTIVGGNQGSPGKAYEQDSFISFDGTQRALVHGVTMRGPYGDYVDMSGLHEAPDGGGAYPSTDVTIRDCRFSGAGRQAIAVVLAKRVVVEDNTILSASATVFDVEFDSEIPAGIQTDILISHNTIVGQHFAFLLAAITAAKIERLRFTGNQMTEGAQMRIWIDPEIVSNDIRIDHNVSTGVTSWPRRASVTLYGTTSAEVDDNTVLVPIYKPGDQIGGPFVTGGPGVEVDHNTLTPTPIVRQIVGREIVAEGGATSCSDRSSSGMLYDRGLLISAYAGAPGGPAGCAVGTLRRSRARAPSPGRSGPAPGNTVR